MAPPAVVQWPVQSPGGHVVFSQEECAEPGDGVETDSEISRRDDAPPTTIVRIPVAGEQKAIRLEHMPRGLCDPRAALALIIVVSQCRRELCLGGRVVELGCGLALPSLVCAIFGAHVVASDLPQALGAIKHNAAMTGFPQDIWKVVAGKVAGGIVVQESAVLGAKKEPEKLSFGALVEAIEQEGELIHYKLLQGTGPAYGWVRRKQPWGQILLDRSTDKPPTESGQGSVRTISVPMEDTEAARDLLQDGNISLILCSDCVNEPLYGEKCWKGLVDCIDILCGPTTMAIVSVQRRLHDGYDGFMERLSSHQNLFVDKLSSSTVGGKQIIVFIIRKRTPPEGFNTGLNDNFEAPTACPPGAPLKVIRNLKAKREPRDPGF